MDENFEQKKRNQGEEKCKKTVEFIKVRAKRLNNSSKLNGRMKNKMPMKIIHVLMYKIKIAHD